MGGPRVCLIETEAESNQGGHLLQLRFYHGGDIFSLLVGRERYMYSSVSSGIHLGKLCTSSGVTIYLLVSDQLGTLCMVHRTRLLKQIRPG